MHWGITHGRAGAGRTWHVQAVGTAGAREGDQQDITRTLHGLHGSWAQPHTLPAAQWHSQLSPTHFRSHPQPFPPTAAGVWGAEI